MTILMSSWYYEKKDLKKSPSLLDGLDMERESRYRREGARFIINIGTKMGLRYDTMATGVVYFHRFYMFHSFKTFPRYVTACCCLFLAGKVEETPKKCKDIIKTAKSFLGDSQFSQFGDDPKEEVMTLERILLQTIKFDLQVDHPYGHLLKYAKCLKGDKVKLQNMVQMAWTFINDSLCTTLCLQWEPEVIAIALMYLAGKLSKFEVVDWEGRTSKHTHWWDIFVEGMSIELLEDICHQVLDLYSTPIPNTPQDSPPATPPTKTTRKPSQPPSPVEVAMASPVQSKAKEVAVGQPIPRLEPGELKRKASQPNPKENFEKKVIRSAPISEGKAIPTITTTNKSPKAATSSQDPDNEAPSPSSPTHLEKISKTSEDHYGVDFDVPFKPNTTSSGQLPYLQTSSFLSNSDIAAVKSVQVINTKSFPPTPPCPPASQYYPLVTSETKNASYGNVQQPPTPKMFPKHHFQPPPLVPSSSTSPCPPAITRAPPCPPAITHAPPCPPAITHALPCPPAISRAPPCPPSITHAPPPPPISHYVDPSLQTQYTAMPHTNVPPFSTQYPPPRPQGQMIIGNPPPAPIPQAPSNFIPQQRPPGLPPQGLPPPPLQGPPHLPHEDRHLHGPQPHMDAFLQHPRLRPPPLEHGRQDFPSSSHFESDRPACFRGRREDYDMSFHHEGSLYDENYRHVSNQFENSRQMQMHQPPRHFPMEHQPHHPNLERSGKLQGAPTGIASVRITGRY